MPAIAFDHGAFDTRAFDAFAPADTPDADPARRLAVAGLGRLLSPAAALRRLALDGRAALLAVDASDRHLEA